MSNDISQKYIHCTISKINFVVSVIQYWIAVMLSDWIPIRIAFLLSYFSLSDGPHIWQEYFCC